MAIETLLNEKKLNSKNKWYPQTLENYKSVVSYGCLSKMDDEIRRNIGYSLQYLEFLELQINELNPSKVLSKMIYKTFIITSMAIIEAVFENIIKYYEKESFEEWEVVKTVESNLYEIDKETYRVRNEILKRMKEPKVKKMKLDDMLKKVKDKKLLDLEFDENLALNRNRKLRNRIHLSNFEEKKTDWHYFDKEEYMTIKYLLYIILTNSKMENEKQKKFLEFLNMGVDESVVKRFKRNKN